MSDEQFKREYLGTFSEDIILKVLKKSYLAVADKDHQIFLPQSVIKQGIDAIEYGAKSEEALADVLELLGRLVNELYKREMVNAQFEVKPFFVSKPE